MFNGTTEFRFTMKLTTDTMETVNNMQSHLKVSSVCFVLDFKGLTVTISLKKDRRQRSNGERKLKFNIMPRAKKQILPDFHSFS